MLRWLLGGCLVLLTLCSVPLAAQEPNWTQKSPLNSPTARWRFGMAYDAARGQVVLFGGDANGIRLNETWVWDGTNWTQKSPANSPTARFLTTMAYDAARGQVVLFGGGDDNSLRGDTWVWDGTNWTQKSPANNPTARYEHAMAYDAARGQVVLFGGHDYNGILRNDTWVWDGTNWTQKSPASSPPGRYPPTMAYDGARAQVVLFGGANSSSSGLLNDTWVWDGTNWTQKSPANSPTPRYQHTMAYDAARGQLVLFGGLQCCWSSVGDTWVWTSTVSSGCQTNVTRLSQGDPRWASNLYDHSTSLTIQGKGCALTSLSMALNTARTFNNPGSLNQFMAVTDTDYAGLGVNWGPATRDASGGGLRFQAARYSSVGNFAASMHYLDTTVCQQGNPVIVGVNLDPDGNPGHFVLVTGKIGNDFQIADPGYSSKTMLSQYNNDFQTRGFVAAVTSPVGPLTSMITAPAPLSSPEDISELNLAIGDAAEFLIVDPSQRRTGYDPILGQVIEEIPNSVYFRDALIDDVTGALPTETTHLAHIFQPAPGTYQIIITGLKLGTYNLSTRMFSQDGSSQPDSTITGVAGPGSTSSFSIQLSVVSGASPIVRRTPTFQSALADINNSLQLGLIDNQGIANSLSQKLQAAQETTGKAKDSILVAFENEVNAQADKHITGVAVQVLLQDAVSLRTQ